MSKATLELFAGAAAFSVLMFSLSVPVHMAQAQKPPFALSAVVSPNSGYAKIGDAVSATITEAGGESDLSLGGSCTINNVDVSGSFTNNDDGTYSLEYDVASGDADAAAGTLPITCTLQDPSNDLVTVSAFAANTLAVDANAPAAPTIGTLAAIDDSNVGSYSFSGTGEANDSFSYSFTDAAAKTLSGNGTVGADGSWTVSNLDVGSLENGTITLSVTQTDPAGNTGQSASATTTKSTSASQIVFSYDPIGQVLTVSTSDHSVFTAAIGTDQLGNGVQAGTDGSSYNTVPGTFGDSVGSEWLITNDFAGSSCNTPTYTGDSNADFASCISAITADGGTYELGTFGTVTSDNGNDPVVTVSGDSDATAAQIDASFNASSAGVDALGPIPVAKGYMTDAGFLVKRYSTFTTNIDPNVQTVDGEILAELISKGIVRSFPKKHMYKLTQNYVFAGPSQPADFVFGDLVDGWTTWATAKGKTLDQLYQHG